MKADKHFDYVDGVLREIHDLASIASMEVDGAARVLAIMRIQAKAFVAVGELKKAREASQPWFRRFL